MRGSHKLSHLFVQKINKPGRYGDGNGLWLQVTADGKGGVTKSWLYRYMLDGRSRQMGLGSVIAFSLKEARERAHRQRQLRADRIDPIEHRRTEDLARRAAQAKALTFREAAENYIAAHRAGWRNPKHAEQWTNTLSTYAYPVIGRLSVGSIDTGHVMRVLEPIWKTKTETASRVRGRIESVLDWAAVRGLRPKGDNPARWRGHLDNLLPARSKVRTVRHQPAMPYGDVPGFMITLRKMDSLSARALEFTILTAARTGEVTGAKWDEIDLDGKVWLVPAERMKSGRDHRVPLSDPAVALLKLLPREEGLDWVFPGAKTGHPLSNMAMLQLLRGVRSGLTVHGFRSSFRDWSAEQTNYASDIAEAALAHQIGDKVQAAYQRGDMLEKRRRLMGAWAQFCGRPQSPSIAGKLVNLYGVS